MRIPGLLDMVRSDDPERIAVLAQDRRLDRRFEPVGPLVNRIVARRVRRILEVGGVPLPSVAPQDFPGRADRQVQLEAALSKDGPPCEDTHLEELAAHVLGRRSPEALGPLVQEVVGRRFAADYRASRRSWEAARLIDKAPRTRNPLRQLVWAVTGRVRRAKRLVAEGVGGDPAAVHAVSIAVHNLVRGLERMRELAAEPAGTVSVEQAVACSISAPQNVLRQADGPGTTPAGEFRRGTLVVFRLEAARARSLRRDLAFMTETWSRCPAHSWVPALLTAVWMRAAEMRGSEGRP